MADPSNPFPILPQYQGDYLDAQRKMALAQALQKQAMTPLSADESGWNQMRVVPHATALSGLAKLGQALLSSNAMNGAINAQRNVGQEQWQGMQQMFQPQSSQGPALQQGNNTASAQDGTQGSGQSYGMMMPGQSAPQQAPSTAPAQSLGPAQNSPMNPAGLPGSAAAMMYLRDPNSYTTNMVAPYYKPTDATLMARAAGLDPAAANAAALAKGNYIAPSQGRAGGYTNIPKVGQDGQVTYDRQYNQIIPQGGQPTFDAAGNVVGVAPLPGAATVAQQQSAATAGGQAMFKPVVGVDANGRPAYNTAYGVATGAVPGQPAGSQSTQFPGATGLGSQPQSASSGSFAPGLPAGSEGLIKDFVDRNDEVSDAAKNAPADIQALREISTAAQNAKTGAGFDRKAAWESMASVIPGVSADASDKTNSDVMGKYVAQIAGRNGGRSDAALDNAIHSIPNSGMSPAAIQQLTPNLIGLRMAELGNANARQSWLQNHGNAPASLMQYEQQWNKNYDPDVYRLQAMPVQQQASFIRSLPPSRAAQLMQSRQALKQLGAIPDLSQGP